MVWVGGWGWNEKREYKLSKGRWGGGLQEEQERRVDSAVQLVNDLGGVMIRSRRPQA